MAKLDQAGLTEAIVGVTGATPDPSGAADLVFDKGNIVVAADPKEYKAAFKRLKKIDGYRWLVINRTDLFAANNLSIGSKAGIMDQDGKILKQADIPRKKR